MLPVKVDEIALKGNLIISPPHLLGNQTSRVSGEPSFLSSNQHSTYATLLSIVISTCSLTILTDESVRGRIVLPTPREGIKSEKLSD